MKEVRLNNTLPHVFQNNEVTESEIWLKQVTFQRKKKYLIEAASGVGKSSLCSYIYGYRNDYSGNIFFNNKDIKELPSELWDGVRRNRLSFLFQELRLFPELTALENIQLKNNLTAFKSEYAIEGMLERLNIIDKRNAVVGKMSWGQQQRVAVIRSLCQPFAFLVLDEPISHLDDKNAEAIATLVNEELYTQEAGLIVTSIGKQLPLEYDQILAL